MTKVSSVIHIILLLLIILGKTESDVQFFLQNRERFVEFVCKQKDEMKKMKYNTTKIIIQVQKT